MEASGACVSLIKRSEGCRLKAYRDDGGVLTVGWGHTGRDVCIGMTITQAWADWLLERDVVQSVKGVLRVTNGIDLTQGMLDALTDFVFNEGIERLQTSTLLKKLRAGDIVGAADEFLRWDYEKIDGQEKKNAQLEQRRRDEQALFLGRSA
jgi:lysozyme